MIFIDPQVKKALLDLIYSVHSRLKNQLAPKELMQRTNNLQEQVMQKKIDDNVPPIVTKLQINIIDKEVRILYEGITIYDFIPVLDWIDDFIKIFEA